MNLHLSHPIQHLLTTQSPLPHIPLLFHCYTGAFAMDNAPNYVASPGVVVDGRGVEFELPIKNSTQVVPKEEAGVL